MSQLPPAFPISVQLHPDPTSPRNEILDQEEWVEAEDSLAHRYSLMEKWATADQRFRDYYHERATTHPAFAAPILVQDGLQVNRFVCLASASRDTHPKEYTHLLKILILLYIVQDGYIDHPFAFSTAGRSPTPQIPIYINPNPSTPPLRVEHTLPALFLRTADFRVMAMTRVGTVVFTKEYDDIWYALDAKSLQTGLMMCATHRRPFNLTQITIFSIGNGWPLEEIIETGIGGWGFWNQPMDMDLPILDILQGVKDSGKFQYAGWGDKELLAREIERAAPGYLELEAEGRAGEFELERLAEIYT